VSVANAIHAIATGLMMHNKIGNFGEWVRRNLTANGKTITWLADQIQGNPTMVIKWRQGVEPRARNYIKACTAIAKLRGDPMAVVLSEGATHLGVSYEHAPHNTQHTKD
jgi:hypothetical protein